MNKVSTKAGQIVQAINERQERIESLRDLAVRGARQTIEAVIEQGQDLALVKSNLEHGHWLPWLAEHCPKISPRLAQLYMRVAANTKRVAHLTQAESLRGALALCCLEEDAGPDGPANEPKQWPAYLEALGRISKLTGYVKKHPVDSWPTEGTERIREELEPLAKSLWPEKFA